MLQCNKDKHQNDVTITSSFVSILDLVSNSSDVEEGRRVPTFLNFSQICSYSWKFFQILLRQLLFRSIFVEGYQVNPNNYKTTIFYRNVQFRDWISDL